MITCLVYLVVGIMIGLLVSHEKLAKQNRSHIEKKIVHRAKSLEQASKNVDVQRYDEILDSMRMLNNGLKEANNKETVVKR